MSLAGLVAVPAMVAVLASCAVAVVSRLLGSDLRQAATFGAVALPVSLFLMLTHYPLPELATFSCQTDRVPPHLMPFHTIPSAIARHGEVPVWSQMLVQAAIANFGLCIVIGIALSFVTTRTWAVIGAAATVSLTVELSQLTGVFGIYPCAVRYFDVDDLILNVGGVAVGFLFMRRWSRKRSQAAEVSNTVNAERPVRVPRSCLR